MDGFPDFSAARLEMIERHLRARGIHSDPVISAMEQVPRERFVLADSTNESYADRALAIDCGQTISQPYMVALMTEALNLSGGEHVLEVGTGSGYQTAVLAELVPSVVTIERHGELSRSAQSVLAELGYGNIRFVVGDGTRGFSEAAPYDRVLVTAAAAASPPALFDQLSEGGILVAPLGGETQTLCAIRKNSGRLESRALTACRFVPLVADEGA